MARKIVAYEAEDGTTFKSQSDADAHDAKLERDRAIDAIVQEMQRVDPNIDVAAISGYLRDEGSRIAVLLGEKPQKRTRRTKAQMAAEAGQLQANAAPGAPSNADAPQDDGQMQTESNFPLAQAMS